MSQSTRPELSLVEGAHSSRILATGHVRGSRVVTNEEMCTMIDSTPEWIEQRTGIKERRWATAEQTPRSMAVEAARKALAKIGMDPAEIGAVVCATVSHHRPSPSLATYVAHDLGANSAVAFDLNAACAGFCYSMSVADSMIRTGAANRALVIGAEVFSRILDWSDRGTCVLFGDGAGAVVLEASERPGILATALHADGSHNPILAVPGQINRGEVVGDPFLRMDGQAVFKFAVKVLADVAREVMGAAGLGIDDVDWLIPHQANIRIIQATGKRLGVPPEKVIATVGQHGNTSAASIPLALDLAVRDGRIQRGHKILLEGVGGGFTWGAALLEF